MDQEVKIELLIGRDIPQVHHVLDQVIGDKAQPFAQRLLFGWVIIGEVCIGQVHAPREVNVRKTQILNDGRCTTFPLCPYNISVKSREDELFVRTPDDNKVGLSVEDKQFLKLMDEEFKIDETGHWSASLPFKNTKPVMPNNYPQALKRTHIFDASLRKDSNKRQHFFASMEKVLSSGAEEVAPTKTVNDVTFLCLGYHPKKPNQIHGVFDSNAGYEGTSLNSVLMSGPDLTNNLVGNLMRFRKDAIGSTGDIEEMFYGFRVD